MNLEICLLSSARLPPQKQAAGVRGHGRKRESHHFLSLFLQRLVERMLIQLFAKPALAPNVLRLFFNLQVSEGKSSSVVIKVQILSPPT